MPIEKLLSEKHEEIRRIAARHGVGKISVFGSAARGETNQTSDVDFIIEVTGPTTPWFPGGLVADLEALLSRRVDVVELNALREPIRRNIIDEAIPL